MIECTATTPRCEAITRAQQAFAADKGLLRTVVREADQNVGVLESSQLRIGESVWLK